MGTKDKQDGIVAARGRKSLTVGAEHLLLAFKTIIDEGREEEFVKACKAADLSLNVPPATINFLKRFVATPSPEPRGKSFAKSAAKPMSTAARNLADCDECR